MQMNFVMCKKLQMLLSIMSTINKYDYKWNNIKIICSYIFFIILYNWDQGFFYEESYSYEKIWFLKIVF